MTVDGFLSGDFMNASDDEEDIEEDEQVHFIIHPSWSSRISPILFNIRLKFNTSGTHSI